MPRFSLVKRHGFGNHYWDVWGAWDSVSGGCVKAWPKRRMAWKGVKSMERENAALQNDLRIYRTIEGDWRAPTPEDLMGPVVSKVGAILGIS